MKKFYYIQSQYTNMKKLKNLFFEETPETTGTQPTIAVGDGVMVLDDVSMSDVLSTYEVEFNRLNIAGHDFYEFAQAISRVDDADPKTYQVIQLTLGLQRKELLANAQFYVEKLQEFHEQNAQRLSAKLDEVKATRIAESSESVKQIEELQNQIRYLQGQLDLVQGALLTINQKHEGTENYLLNQTKANGIARDTMVSRINTVVEGIKQHIK